MHLQVKEHLAEDIHYLRQLNMQMLEIPMKGVCGVGGWETSVRKLDREGIYSCVLFRRERAGCKGMFDVCVTLPLYMCSISLQALFRCFPVILGFVWVCAAEKATEILKKVKEAQDVFRRQRDVMKIESEVIIK